MMLLFKINVIILKLKEILMKKIDKVHDKDVFAESQYRGCSLDKAKRIIEKRNLLKYTQNCDNIDELKKVIEILIIRSFK